MKSRLLRAERLESRYCLSGVINPPALNLTVNVVQNDLVVSGAAADQVVIRATGQGSFDVLKGGSLVDHVDGVTGGIRMNVHALTAASEVAVDLAGTQVDWVLALLGGGNDLTVQNGTISGTLQVFGTSGNDTLAVNNVAVDEVMALLGHGNNQVSLGGQVNRAVTVRGGLGNDTVKIDATVGGALSALLDEGTNQLEVNGTVGGRLMYRAGDGNDTVSVAEGGELGRGAVVFLGNGTNKLEIDGKVTGSLIVNGGLAQDTVTVGSPTNAAANVSVDMLARLGAGGNILDLYGSVGRNLNYTGADGADQVHLYDQANVGGTVSVAVGLGTNWVIHEGSVGGHFIVTTANEADVESRIDLSAGTVGGGAFIHVVDGESGTVLRRKVVVVPPGTDLGLPPSTPSPDPDPSSGPSKSIG